MKRISMLGCWACLATFAFTGTVAAHVMPWRAGESRQLGFGHGSKGPCVKRTCWSTSRPHRHEHGRVVVSRYGGPECFARQGVSKDIRARVLNHVDGARSVTDAVYNQHEFQAEKRAALKLWEDELRRVVAKSGR